MLIPGILESVPRTKSNIKFNRNWFGTYMLDVMTRRYAGRYMKNVSTSKVHQLVKWGK